MTDTEINRILKEKCRRTPDALERSRYLHRKYLARQRWGHDLEGRLRYHQEKAKLLLEILEEDRLSQQCSGGFPS